MKWTKATENPPKKHDEYFIRMFHINAQEKIEKCYGVYDPKIGWVDFEPGWRVIEWLDESNDGWISVDDKMPSVNIKPGVLTYGRAGYYGVTPIFNCDGKANFEQGWRKGEFHEVTHWQPLPFPPAPKQNAPEPNKI